MWIVTILFLVPALTELLNPAKSPILGLIWLGLAVATSPIYPVSNRNRVFVILFLFVGFIMALVAEHEGVLTATVNWLLMFFSGAVIATLLALFSMPFTHRGRALLETT